MTSFRVWAGGLALIVAGCSGGSTGTSGGGTSGSVPAGAGLTGTWDLVATSDGESQGTGTLAISATSLNLTLGSTSLAYAISGDSGTLLWTEYSDTENLKVTRTSAAFDTGALSLSLGGSWSVVQGSRPADQCSGTIGTDSSAQCTNAELPDPFPRPRDGQIYAGTRTAPATSIFGDLGGTWTFNTGSNSRGCTATFNGSQVMLHCDSYIGELEGGVTLTFNAALTSVSGTTTEGSELAGHKH